MSRWNSTVRSAAWAHVSTALRVRPASDPTFVAPRMVPRFSYGTARWNKGEDDVAPSERRPAPVERLLPDGAVAAPHREENVDRVGADLPEREAGEVERVGGEPDERELHAVPLLLPADEVGTEVLQ